MNPKNLKPNIEECKREAPDDTKDRMIAAAGMVRSIAYSGETILDIGAGLPAVSDFIDRNLYKIIKVEPEKYPWADMVFDATKRFPISDSSIDIVIAGDIMEHIPESMKFLKEIRRILTNKGHLIISVPNAVSLRRRAGWVLGKIPKSAARADASYENDVYGDNPYMGHVRDYSLSDLKAWLKKAGFNVLDVKGTGVYSGKGETLIPTWFTPITLGDELIALCGKGDNR